MNVVDAATIVGTALGSAVVALRGRATWNRLRVRKDGTPRCELCSHRCVYCKKIAMQVSDPPADEETTPKRYIPRRRP